MKSRTSLAVHSAPDLPLELVGVGTDGTPFRVSLTIHSALHLIADLSHAVAASAREPSVLHLNLSPEQEKTFIDQWKHNKSRGE